MYMELATHSQTHNHTFDRLWVLHKVELSAVKKLLFVCITEEKNAEMFAVTDVFTERAAASYLFCTENKEENSC